MRKLLRATTAAASGTAAVLVAGPVPAQAAGEWVRVNPTTIQAGNSVTVEASCGFNVNSAKVRSQAFGEQTLLPSPDRDFLYGVVTVPAQAAPKAYAVTLTCATGGRATTTLWVISMGVPTEGPHTGGGALANGVSSGRRPLLLLGGLGALVGATVLGVVSLRRRARAGP